MSENQNETPLDPAAVLGDRDDRVYGVVDDPGTDVSELEERLRSLDVEVDLDSMQVHSGRSGLDELDPEADDGGVMQRIKRTIQSIGYEGRYLDLIERELKAGHALVAVSVTEENQTAVIAAMKDQGAHDMHRHNKLTIVDL
ncbi:MAG: hypothetical protein R2704_15770 [Microthrixaceae bacterium]